MNISKYKEHAESFIKLFTIILGTLYIIGILIQSISSDSLGIPSDSFLQIRSVMTGLSFLVYLLFFVIIFFSGILLLYVIFSPFLMRKWLSLINYFWIPSILLIPYVIGVLIGFMTPWGREMDKSNIFTERAWSISFAKQDILAAFDNLRFAYYHPKIKLCLLFLFLIALVAVALNRKNISDFLSIIKEIIFPQNPFILGASIGVIISILPLFFITYGIEVYPNIRVNMGGGQPNIVQLITAKTDTVEQKSNQITETYVLWRQGETFSHLSLLDSSIKKTTQVIAIKTSSIEQIRYLTGYVKIVEGNQIDLFKIEKE